MQKEKLQKLAAEKNNPCVSISLNTHRTYPDNSNDTILLKNLLNEAREKILAAYDKRSISGLLEKIENTGKIVDPMHHLESLHIFLSESTQEIIKLPVPIENNTIHVADHFVITPLIKMISQTEEYLVLLLSQSGVHIYKAINDAITDELKNEDFPIKKNPHYVTDSLALSDPGKHDNLLRTFLNEVDKAVLKVHHTTELRCVVVSTPNNFGHLKEVMDKPSVYMGQVNINYNDVSLRNIAKQAWTCVSGVLKESREEAIREILEAVGSGLVATDPGEIYRAVKEGRGALLLVNNKFKLNAKIKGENSEVRSDLSAVTEDITGEIAWDVTSKKGRVVFADSEDLHSLGDIALKLRY